ncbi:MAG: aminoglycoside phosphotransferase family protein [Paenibacillus dendritiformis]|uniref:phosphotransferase enzyme family protein n=1 Tax=uncultured Paenibacillus sp. TaxID=227322 RepID=UPI0025F0356E|nr:aminoglycoside phosphotransferase family protein [uncultured Paenibacillus sp.]MDU5145598.1 aminoglycoside phosphotransferase family protein [Paenibacillus dendritiformis]
MVEISIFLLKNRHYDIEGAKVIPQQGGWSALAFKAGTAHQDYFLKMYEKSRASTPKWTALIDNYVPVLLWLLRHSGLKGKIPVPLLTKSGHYQCEDENGIYLMYEYIHGAAIGGNALTTEQVCQLADIMGELHRYGEDIPLATDALKEDFQVPFARSLKEFWQQEHEAVPGDVRERINPYREQILALVDSVEKRAERLKNSNIRLALCHTDIHPWNMMQSGQQLVLIDWEGLKLAPVEADMMFLVDEPFFESFIRIYRKRHPDYAVDADALQFYQGRRKLEDIWEFLEQLVYDGQDAPAREETLAHLNEELRDLSNSIATYVK